MYKNINGVYFIPSEELDDNMIGICINIVDRPNSPYMIIDDYSTRKNKLLDKGNLEYGTGDFCRVKVTEYRKIVQLIFLINIVDEREND